jgi:excisionase family DNA binding protein
MNTRKHDEMRGALTVSGFCQVYRIGRTRVYQEIKEGRLRAKKLGAKTLILHTDAEAWAHSLPNMGGNK